MNLKTLNESMNDLIEILSEALINPYSPRENHISANWRHYGAKDHADLARTHAALSDLAKKPSVANTHKFIAKYHNAMSKRKQKKGYKPRETIPHDPTSRSAAEHAKADWSKVRRSTHRGIADYHTKMAKRSFHQGQKDRAAEHAKIANLHQNMAGTKRGDWFKYLTKSQQSAYLQQHPRSKFKSGGLLSTLKQKFSSAFGSHQPASPPSSGKPTGRPAPTSMTPNTRAAVKRKQKMAQAPKAVKPTKTKKPVTSKPAPSKSALQPKAPKKRTKGQTPVI